MMAKAACGLAGPKIRCVAAIPATPTKLSVTRRAAMGCSVPLGERQRGEDLHVVVIVGTQFKAIVLGDRQGQLQRIDGIEPQRAAE
jgi:hypothetical protein